MALKLASVVPVRLAMAVCIAFLFSFPCMVGAQSVKDVAGNDSGFQHVMTFGSKGTGDGQFNYPEDFAIALDGKHLLVTDAVNSNIQVFDKTTGKFVTKFGGKGDANHQLEKPEGISVAPDGRIFVADYATGFVKIYDKDFKWLKTFSDYGDKPGENMKSEFTSIFDGKYYMPEAGNHRVNVWDLDGKFLFTFGKKGSQDGEFDVPESIKANSKGEFFVADLKNTRIQVFDKDGKFLRKWGEAGSENGQLKAPAGIGIDKFDNIYVTEIGNDQVQVFDQSGKFLTRFGKKGTKDGEFSNLHGCFVDKESGWVYVADSDNCRVQVFKPTAEILPKLQNK
jgi:DNA-binding beta-propeller fold protein YncE